MKGPFLKDIKLYVIIDMKLISEAGFSAVDVLKAAFRGGTRMFQLRHKGVGERVLFHEAQELSRVAHELGALFIVNDSVSVALSTGADGVHLGENDLPIHAARKICPDDFIIGASAGSLERALQAEKEGASYVGYGAIFPTTTKEKPCPGSLDELVKINKVLNVPVFAIGGINEENVVEVTRVGVKRICVASAVIKSENPELTAKKLLEALA